MPYLAHREQLFDHVIRPLQERSGHRQPESLGGLQVDHQLELRGLLDGEVGRSCAFEDSVDVGGRVPNHCVETRALASEVTRKSRRSMPGR